MKVVIFCNKMPDLCGAFLHDIDLGLELQRRGHTVVFLTIIVPKIRYTAGNYRGFTYIHYSAGERYLETSDIWLCPHSPILPDVRKLNARWYNRPIVATCHFDGNYQALTKQHNSSFNEMVLFINSIMESTYRKQIVPWPPSIKTTAAIRPIMHRDKIVITEPFQGDFITLINANINKGLLQFIDIAKAMPEHKFLGVLPYYAQVPIPPAPNNITWIPFDDDIRNILKRTYVLIMPSYYESFGRVAVEAMINGIPVLYTKPFEQTEYTGGTTDGIQSWIGDAAIPCSRDNIQEWVTELKKLDDSDVYQKWSEKSKAHIESMNLFTEASRIAQLIETFSKDHPVEQRQVSSQTNQPKQVEMKSTMIRAPPQGFRVGFSNGRLRVPR
jgi:glycosyltransferase involved in cell wall biosynthesis